ncbi:MAG: PepSY domain-containing protein [Propylenella sp.]
MKKLLTAVAFAATVGAAGFANAQSIEFGPGGVRINPPGFEEPYRYRDRISEREAIRIARRNGVREVEFVDRRRDVFEVEGFDRRDRRIVVVIDRRSGDVLDIDRS